MRGAAGDGGGVLAAEADGTGRVAAGAVVGLPRISCTIQAISSPMPAAATGSAMTQATTRSQRSQRRPPRRRRARRLAGGGNAVPGGRRRRSRGRSRINRRRRGLGSGGRDVGHALGSITRGWARRVRQAGQQLPRPSSLPNARRSAYSRTSATRRTVVDGGLGGEPAQAGRIAAELRQRGGRRRALDDPALAVEPSPRREHHLAGHGGERLVALVTVLAPAEIDLGHRVETDELEDVDEQAEFDPVATGKGHPLEHVTPRGVLAAQRLHEAGELRPELVEQRPGDQLGDAAAPGRADACRRSPAGGRRCPSRTRPRDR